MRLFLSLLLNEMNKGKTYFDLLKVFHIHDTMKNERFILKIYNPIIKMEKFCIFCQEVTPHYVNEYGVLERCNCEPLSESEYESDSSSDFYTPDNCN